MLPSPKGKDFFDFDFDDAAASKLNFISSKSRSHLKKRLTKEVSVNYY